MKLVSFSLLLVENGKSKKFKTVYRGWTCEVRVPVSPTMSKICQSTEFRQKFCIRIRGNVLPLREFLEIIFLGFSHDIDPDVLKF